MVTGDRAMLPNYTSVVLVHGAWADGSSWAKGDWCPGSPGTTVLAAPLPLTSFADDVSALDRTLERVQGPVVLAGPRYTLALSSGRRAMTGSKRSSTRGPGPGRG